MIEKNKPFSQNVFIDTCIFRKYNFEFDHKSMKRLIDLSNLGIIKLFITDIIHKEVIANINESVSKACEKISINDVSILKNINEFKKLLNSKEIIDKLVFNYEEFLKLGGVEIIKTDQRTVSIVINNYFDIKPPFNVKKRKEFPDSFILETIFLWSNDRNQNSYLISTDFDWEIFCQNHTNLEIKKDIEKTIDLFLRQEEDLKQLITFVDNLIEENKEEILIDIIASLDEIPVYHYHIDYDLAPDEYTYCAPDYEIRYVEAEEVLDFKEIELVEINENVAIYNVLAEVMLNVDYYLEDYTHATYEKEDSVWFNVETEEFTKKHKTSINAEIEISYDSQDPDSYKIVSVIPEDSIDIKFYEDESDE